MIMRIFSFDNEIEFSEDYIHVLQIEDAKLFARIVSSINNGINDINPLQENILFLEEDNEVKMSKDIMLIIDIWNFDFNQKKIQTALFQHMEKTFQIEYERMHQFNTLIKKLEIDAMDVWNELPFEFSYKENISITEYLKLIGLKIKCEENHGIVERIFSIIDIVEYFRVAKLVVFVNIKLYLNPKELQEVYKYALYKKVPLLLLETGKEKETMQNEKILFVDSDYDEIVLYNRK